MVIRCGPWTNCITWEFLRTATSRAPLRPSRSETWTVEPSNLNVNQPCWSLRKAIIKEASTFLSGYSLCTVPVYLLLLRLTFGHRVSCSSWVPSMRRLLFCLWTASPFWLCWQLGVLLVQPLIFSKQSDSHLPLCFLLPSLLWAG